jgi:hypothetical protein
MELISKENLNTRFLTFIKQPGIPAFPERQDPGAYDLTPVVIVDLLRHDKSFFPANPVFEPARAACTRALKALRNRGIIDAQGNKGKTSCEGCAYRTLLAATIQMCAAFQQIVLRAQGDLKVAEKLKDDLRQYLAKHRGVTPETRVRLTARLRGNQTHEVFL